MKSQRFQFYKSSQIAALTVELPGQPVVSDWYTYQAQAPLSDEFAGWCAVDTTPSRNTPTTVVSIKPVKGNEDAGVAWAEKHPRADVHVGYNMDKMASKDI
jgi:hypothetical protein